MKYENLQKALTDLGWFYVSDSVENQNVIEEIRKTFDPLTLNEDKTPKINTERKTIIVLDNKDWNETYLIDKVSQVLKQQNYTPGNYDLIYVDSIKARMFVQNPNFTDVKKFEEEGFEKNELRPAIIVINPNKNVIVAQFESFVLEPSQIIRLFNWLDDDFCDKNK